MSVPDVAPGTVIDVDGAWWLRLPTWHFNKTGRGLGNTDAWLLTAAPNESTRDRLMLRGFHWQTIYDAEYLADEIDEAGGWTLVAGVPALFPAGTEYA